MPTRLSCVLHNLASPPKPFNTHRIRDRWIIEFRQRRSNFSSVLVTPPLRSHHFVAKTRLGILPTFFFFSFSFQPRRILEREKEVFFFNHEFNSSSFNFRFHWYFYDDKRRGRLFPCLDYKYLDILEGVSEFYLYPYPSLSAVINPAERRRSLGNYSSWRAATILVGYADWCTTGFPLYSGVCNI